MGGASSVGNIAWTAEADSPSCPGEKCILSGPIQDLTMAQVLETIEIFIRERPPNTSMYEVDRKLTTLPDGGLHEQSFVKVTGMAALFAGSIELTLNSVFYFDGDELVIESFFTDSSLKEKATRTLMKALDDPFRLEVQTDEYEVRRAGPILQAMVKQVLKGVGYKVEVLPDQAATCGSGPRSVLSDDLGDPALTTRALWERHSAKLESDEVCTSLPDGSLVVEAKGYHRWSYDEKEDLIRCLSFGDDEQLEDHRSTSHWKVVDDPKRLEVFAMSVPGRRAGGEAQKMVSDLLSHAFTFAEKRGK